MTTDRDRVLHYHDETKHHIGRYARSLGYLDWASQPRPFRSFRDSPQVRLFPDPGAGSRAIAHSVVTYDQLCSGVGAARPVTVEAIGDVLRHALGVSAWKVFQHARWSLRVNPSSGNLHPTEAYLITAAVDGLSDEAGVWHYAADRHQLERRCMFDSDSWSSDAVQPAVLIALTSIHWREAWKYGERAFRYCQHDLGHAIAALSLSARLQGWRLSILPEWPQRSIAALVGLDRTEDYFEAEGEEPACLLSIGRSRPDVDLLLQAVGRGRWLGRASQLSEDHVEWTFIDDVARATEDAGQLVEQPDAGPERQFGSGLESTPIAPPDRRIDARSLLLQRRSAVALDGMSSIGRGRFLELLRRVMPGAGAPWDAIWWRARIHLAIFVHRVDGIAPGLYLLARGGAVVPRLRAACDPRLAWTPVGDVMPLWLLQAGDYRLRSKRVSCDQDIAADGFFSLGMIADFDASLAARGPSFYRQLFWESGIVGQVLYLEAEAAGARATGIGCFFDDEMHRLLGLTGHAFQSLYHFTVGRPVEDSRLTTEPGYGWEAGG